MRQQFYGEGEVVFHDLGDSGGIWRLTALERCRETGSALFLRGARDLAYGHSRRRMATRAGGHLASQYFCSPHLLFAWKSHAPIAEDVIRLGQA